MIFSNIGGFFRDRTAVIILITGLLIRGIAGALIPPGFDEAYYGNYPFHPAWGYFDHPPMVALTAGFGPWLSGSFSWLSLRAGAIILFLFSSFFLYQTTKELFDIHAARISLILFSIIPYFLLGMGAFVIPDNALGFFWILFLFSLAKIQKTQNPKWFILSGISLGLALLSKYHAVLLLGGLGLSLIFIKDWRIYFKSPYLYAGFIASVIIFLPNILWNAQHDWVSYIYQFAKSADRFRLSFSMFLQGIFIQAGYLLPWHMFVLLAAIWHSRKNRKIYFLLPFALLPVLIFALIGATREILPHWPMPGYMAAIILTGGWMNGWAAGTLKKYLAISSLFIVVITVLISLQAVYGILPLGKKADLTLDGFGWDDLVHHLEEKQLTSNDSTFLFTHRWFTAGELFYAGKGKYTVTVFNSGGAHGYAFWTEMSSYMGKDGVFFSSERHPGNPSNDYKKYFSKIERLEDFTVYRSGNPAKTYYIWKCFNLHTPFPWPYGNK